jgi:hypothetical protein
MRVAVLGAGLQGACVAMELAAAGVEVDLYDRNDRCVSQASAQNEGKIHLGYVYANESSLETARIMVSGAASFAPLMRRWIGSDIDRVPVSSPFYYAVHRNSLISAERLEQHLLAANAIAREEVVNYAVDYFGVDYREAPTRLIDHAGLFCPETIVAAFKTPEVGIDPEALGSRVQARLAADPKIRCIMRANVLDVALGDRGVGVLFEVSGDKFREDYDHVVNALWDGRLTIDARAGVKAARPWLFRIKHYVRVEAAPVATSLPSTTMVLGPFGDVVAYANGSVYLSWYPVGMRGVSSELQPPDWPRTLHETDAMRVRQGIVSALSAIIPALADFPSDCIDSAEVKGGIIFAWGSSDIDDPSSGLHARADIGPQSFGRYHSINTGKLTMAPLFAKMAADRILGA